MATIRQKRAIVKTLENGGNVTKAMREVGYSENTINNPQNLLQSKAWNELVEEFIPDSLLAKVHTEGLAAFKYESQLTGKGESKIVKVPDFSVRHKYLDTGYKVKAKYGNEGGNNILVINLSGETSSRYATNPSSITDSD